MLHLRPHTSCRWPCNLRSDCSGGARISRCRIRRSLLPEDSWSTFHANAPGSRNTHTQSRNLKNVHTSSLLCSQYVAVYLFIDTWFIIKCNFSAHLFSYIRFCSLLFYRTPLTHETRNTAKHSISLSFTNIACSFMAGKSCKVWL